MHSPQNAEIVTITTKDILVASAATLTLTNAGNSGVLTFIGSAETDGIQYYRRVG